MGITPAGSGKAGQVEEVVFGAFSVIHIMFGLAGPGKRDGGPQRRITLVYGNPNC
jgi:hypothetical protein